MPEKFEKGNLKEFLEKKKILEEYQRRVAEELKKNPIELLPPFSKITIEELKEQFPDKKRIIACDFYIENIELGEENIWGYSVENVVNIDHHAPMEKMLKPISSTNLAIAYLKEQKIVSQKDVVVINHTDCDSVLSSAIVRGILPPEKRFGDAAIAADHSGEKNEIADLLMALEKERNLEYSLINLKLLLDHKDLDERAKILLEKRLDERKRAEELIQSGGFKQIGNVWYAKVDEKIDSVFFPALLPEAMVIIIASPLKNSDKLDIKVRLGIKAPYGLMLNKLDLCDFGGRWNAGSTKRHGGTAMPLEKYAQMVDDKIKKYLTKKN